MGKLLVRSRLEVQEENGRIKYFNFYDIKIRCEDMNWMEFILGHYPLRVI
jgi:hypothetical protein